MTNEKRVILTLEYDLGDYPETAALSTRTLTYWKDVFFSNKHDSMNMRVKDVQIVPISKMEGYDEQQRT
jgi:hypothetical protein